MENFIDYGVDKAKSTNWIFTWNNYDDASIAHLAALDCKYLVYGRELAPTTGTPHLQGTVVFRSEKSMRQMKKMIDDKIWCACCKSLFKSIVYCLKDGDSTEMGVRPMNPKEKGDSQKRKWAEVIKWSENGDEEKIKAAYPDVYFNKLNLIRSHAKLEFEDLDCLEHEWHYGPTGTGKSQYANALRCEDGRKPYKKKPNTVWFDGYRYQDTVLIEEVGPSHAHMVEEYKTWAELYPFPAEVKHGHISEIRPKKVIVCSNYHPSEIWKDPEQCEPFLRKFILVPHVFDPDYVNNKKTNI